MERKRQQILPKYFKLSKRSRQEHHDEGCIESSSEQLNVSNSAISFSNVSTEQDSRNNDEIVIDHDLYEPHINDDDVEGKVEEVKDDDNDGDCDDDEKEAGEGEDNNYEEDDDDEEKEDEDDNDVDIDDDDDDDDVDADDDDAVATKISSDVNTLTLNSEMSIFKLENNRIPQLSKTAVEISAFHDLLIEILTSNKRLRLNKPVKDKDMCPPYRILHFVYETEKKENITASQIIHQRNYQKGEPHCGDRRTGNILVFYRIKKDKFATPSHPESFFLCKGSAFQAILQYCDPLFRTQVAKHFMDDKKIKEIETYNIAGPDIVDKIIFKGNANFAAQTGAYIEKAIASLSGIIRRGSKLDQLIQGDGHEDVLMTVGLNFVKICKPLPYSTWAEVLTLFSDVLSTNFDGECSYVQNALEYVRRVADKSLRLELDKLITEAAIEVISDRKPSDDYFLSHRYVRNWSLSSSVVLSNSSYEEDLEIHSWYSAPTLKLVIDKIHEYFGSKELIKTYLTKKNITMSFFGDGKKVTHPVQEFVHGSVKKDGGMYFKLGQKWFYLSSTFSQVVDRNFNYLANSVLKDEQILKLVKYPWRLIFRKFTVNDLSQWLGVTERNAKLLIEVLTREITLLDDEQHCILSKYSCILPKSTELYQEINVALNGDHRSKKKTQKSKVKAKKNMNTVEKYFKQSNSPPDTTSHAPEDSVTTNLSGDNFSMDNSSVTGLDNQEDEPHIQPSTSRTIMMPSDSFGNDFGEHESIPAKDKVKTKVRLSIFQLINQSEEQLNNKLLLPVLKRKRHICVLQDEKYKVRNAILTTDVIEEIRAFIPNFSEAKLLNFLKFMSPLDEGEYNELYLQSKHSKRFVIFPGDRVCLGNVNVELFDILIYDSEKRYTYLFHIKEGLNNNMRDACAQIRNSSELLWHDFTRGQTNHINLFWDSVVNSKDAESPYRIFLREKLIALGKDRFIQMFNDKTRIIFVLAFAIPQLREGLKYKFDFKPISEKNFIEEKMEASLMRHLQDCGFLTELGYLTDVFIGLTQEKFNDRCKSCPELSKKSRSKLNKLYGFLRRVGTCNIKSTIAKLEILTLDACFGRYQIGGESHFQLKLLQLDTF